MENPAPPRGSGWLPASIVALGLAIGGRYIGNGIYRSRAERYVSVKGLVERDIRADLALWMISYSAAGPDLATANDRLVQDQNAVVAFAQAHGFGAGEIALQPATVTDTYANAALNSRPDADQRYLVKGGLQIRSTKVDQVRRASQDTGDLIKQGVALGENYPQAPQYFFTHLNDIRPAMLAAATRSARGVAEKFAADSHSRLGPIRRANQGVFEITGRDATGDNASSDDQSSIDKKVRLVSTVDYYLID